MLGYNTNVRHKGRVFHIQTEDSGISHPHVITHLFADGGRILKSNKTSYADIVSAPDYAAQVKKIMQDQHKAMFIALRDGQFDHLFDAGPADPKDANAPSVSGDLLSSAQVSSSEPKPSNPSVAAPKPSQPSVAAPPAASAVASAAPSVDGPKRSSSVAIPALKPPMPPGVTAVDPPARPAASAPPPAATTRPSTAPPTGSSTRPPSQRPPPRPAGASGHYQAVRAPEILGSFKPREDSPASPASIFGDGLMSEKSLDEVILAYLAEDLDDNKR
ncbi:MAG: hypothetical protein JNK05_31775 [Myxococcales bacterium]|nr:hypothetical protein [Myxococcales bacterium]